MKKILPALSIAVCFLVFCSCQRASTQHQHAVLVDGERFVASPFFDDEEFDRVGASSVKEVDRNLRGDLGGGILSTSIGSSDDVIRAVTLSSDGNSLFVAGRIAGGATSNDFLIGKMDFVGNWDTTFSSDGWTTTDFGSNRDEVAHAVAWQTDGKVVLAGRAHNGTNLDFALARYNTDGSLDNGFGTSGKKTHTVGSGADIIRSLVFQTDGMLVAGGYAYNGSNYDFVASRYSAAGALDNNFGTGGTVQIDVTTRDDVMTSAAVLTNGKVLFSGAFYNASNNWDIYFTQVHTDGQQDNDFNGTGAITITGGGDNIIWASALDSSQRLIAVGENNNGSNADFLAIRILQDAVVDEALDTSFAGDGIFTSTISSGNDIARGVAVTTDGKTVLAGSVGNTDVGILKLNVDGTVDTAFGTSGSITQSVGSAEDSGLSVAAKNSGQIYVGGRTYNGSNYDIALVRRANQGIVGFWSHQAFLKAPNADSGDFFGTSADISGDTIAVGAISEDANDTTIINGTTGSTNNAFSNAGAVYVFVRSGSTWTQQAYLKPAVAEGGDVFGFNLSIDSDTLAVGVPREDSNQLGLTNGTSAPTDNAKTSAGAAYVFRRTGTQWAQEAYLKPPFNGNFEFGLSNSVNGDTVVIGAPYEDSAQTTITNGSTAATDAGAGNSGAAYVFTRSGSTWVQEAFIKPANAGGAFGFTKDFARSVSVYGNTLAVGSREDSGAGTAVVNGTSASTDFGANAGGAAFVYTRSGTVWSQQAWIKASNAEASDYFGSGVSIHSDSLAVVAPGESSNQVTITNGTSASTNNANAGSGAVYVYSRSGTVWTPQAYLKAPNASSGDGLGSDFIHSTWSGDNKFPIKHSGDTIAVATWLEDSPQNTITNGSSVADDDSLLLSGATYVFVRSGSIWGMQAYVKPPNVGSGDAFGSAIGLHKDTLVVGAPLEDSSQNTITNGSTAATDNASTDSGAVYIFTR